MYRSVLVPLDGSPFAEQALPVALSVARRTGSSLQLVHVHSRMDLAYPEPQLVNEESLIVEWKTRHRVYLDGMAERARAAGAGAVTAVVLHGDVVECLQKHVVEQQVDLVVMTTHARGPIARMWLGSVADRLIRESPRPLLLVHPIAEKPQLSADVVLKHILLPLDGTPLAEQIIAPATALGEALGAEDYTLLRVVRPLTPAHYPAEGLLSESMSEQLERTETELRRRAQEYLDDVSQRFRDRLLRVRTQVADETQPAVAVIDAAQRLRADLIAMQTHGRRGLSRLVLGSVADKVLRGSPVPLLVQRPVPSA